MLGSSLEKEGESIVGRSPLLWSVTTVSDRRQVLNCEARIGEAGAVIYRDSDRYRIAVNRRFCGEGRVIRLSCPILAAGMASL